MESVRSFEKWLINHYCIDVPFVDYMNNQREIKKNRYIKSKIVYISSFYLTFRHLILAISKSKRVWWFLGDALYLVGERVMVNVCLFFCGLYTSTTLTAFHVAERKGTNFWYAPMARMIKGVERPREVGLIQDSYNQWCQLFRLFVAVKLLLIGAKEVLSIYFVASAIFGCWAEGFRLGPMLGFLINGALMAFFARYWVSATYLEMFGNGISAYYLIKRFDDLNQRIVKIAVEADSLFLGRTFEQRLMTAMHDHSRLTRDVRLYDKRWSWSVFSAYVVLMPILAVNIFTVFFNEMSIYVKFAMVPLLTEHLVIIFGCLLSSSMLHKVAHDAHNSFASIAACSGTSLKLETNLKLLSTLKRLAEKSIGFYLYDMFPITYSHVASFLANSVSTFILVFGFVYDV